MSNENSNYVFGNLIKEPGDYELRAPHLSINPISPDKFKQKMFEHEIPPEQATAIWKFLCEKTNEAYDAHLLSQKEPQAMTRESLEKLEMDSSEWQEFGQTLGLDSDLIDNLFQDYQAEVTEVFEQQIEAQEQAEQQAQEAQEAESADDEPDLSDEALDTIINDIRKSDAYWNDKAPIAEHQRAVDALEKVMMMRQGLIPRKMSDVSRYAQEIKDAESQLLKDQYGRSTLKPGAYDSSNKVKGSRSEEQPDINPDSIAQGGESSSNVGGSESESEGE